MANARIAVFGAGLVGAYAGLRLAGPAHVVLIGRPALVEMARKGLAVSDLSGFHRRLEPHDLEVTTDPAALAGAQLVLVTVKSMATAEAGRAIAAHAPPSAPVLSLQNGVSNVEVLRAALPDRVVLAGMVPFNVAQPEPGRFHRGTGEGHLVVDRHPALDSFRSLFETAGLPLRPHADMRAVLWGKLLVNLNNAVNALSGVSLMEELRQRAFRQAWAWAMAEGLKLVRRADIRPVDPLPLPLELMPSILGLPDRLYRFVVAQAGGGRARVDPLARSSMADDLAQGRPTEVDYLNGEIVRLAERLGLGAPVNARMVELVHAAERGAPPWPGPALLAELRAARRAAAR
ncbi:MAG: 2-dehydropantoate 2-reductase [Sphingomonadaceae bacterium]|uniref:2-dehydropantoate 2-reductase n=1 Tax=Thermaurantiacus sp. TaxID=2820283 RepID=UPI00298EE86C|nr:2-dehydropantoate 2-reductase [Thermaurantiacus sp.]MCS6985851.1 2-dehydropantoate 2-reductase [Sphingomonadaceae bacterium]MDW8413880.1 2-dehydropantoate 2-reductase [Thermaurantiacus sp.]